MFPVSSQTRFFLYSEPTDMRKSFDGLSGIVINELNVNPLSGDVYIFINKRRDRIKLLIWDRNGFWLLYKRLEQGRFQKLFFKDSKGAYISYESLIMLLEGIDLNSVKRRKRYAK
ncbi:IS66 family insertion sequence element accessory protein TnpB [Calditrichota bacterium LG25]